jgi:hypothetical protein
MFTTTSLPSLRTLEVHLTKLCALGPSICDFLRRSLCPLQVLSIHHWVSGDRGGKIAIQALIDVLENTTMLQQLVIALSSPLFGKLSFSSLKPLVRRLLRDRGFLPCLQTLSLQTEYVPQIGLLLDMMEVHDRAPEVSDCPTTVRPLQRLSLDLSLLHAKIPAIPQDDLLRILQLRAAGQTISMTMRPLGRERSGGTTDLVECWKSIYGIGEE